MSLTRDSAANLLLTKQQTFPLKSKLPIPQGAVKHECLSLVTQQQTFPWLCSKPSLWSPSFQPQKELLKMSVSHSWLNSKHSHDYTANLPSEVQAPRPIRLQRKGLLYSQGKVCCGVMSERHSFLTASCGIGSLDFRGKVCCIVNERFAVESRVRDTHF